ncbi:hypothetical protein C1H46_024694 [Malus baccata]|uniref:Uncharacterized protein n=1 Tax=Malus baccata TaxID=106549 RepID=A0A540LT67_MALBA|nr:hypothetical protein C1H46_024694 [Malus baccata]
MSYRHLSRDFKVEHKVFILEIEDKSFGERIRVTERTRTRGYQISFDLGCAAWIIEQLKAVITTGGLNFFRKYKGHNYQFWVEGFQNRNGEFLVLSKTEKDGFVRHIFVPKGFKGIGWRNLEELMYEILQGGKKTGNKLRKMNRVGTEPRRDMSGAGTQGSYRDAVTGGRQTTKEEYNWRAREELWKEFTWNQRKCSKESYSWGSVVVCERKVVHQSWREVEASLRNLLGTDIRLSPFQCNKALFVCQNEEEAKKIALLGAIGMKEYPEVKLAGWWESLNTNQRMAVSYGGWVALEGLPPHLWTKKFFQDIGEACGGLADIDQTTAGFGFLLEAKIKLKTNLTGFIPEVVEVADGDLVFRVRIRQLSPAKRPMIPAEDRGRPEAFVGSLEKEQQLQRTSGTCHPATAELGEATHATGKCASFRIGTIDCPVTIGGDRMFGHDGTEKADASYEKPANQLSDSIVSEREYGTPLQTQGGNDGGCSSTEGAQISSSREYFNGTSVEICTRNVAYVSLGKSKRLELDGKEGGGSSTEGAQISSRREFFNGTRVEICIRNIVEVYDGRGPNKNNFIPIKLDGVVGSDIQSPNIGDNMVVTGLLGAKNLFSIINGKSMGCKSYWDGSSRGPFIQTIHGIRHQFEKEILYKSQTLSNPLEDLRLLTLRHPVGGYMVLGDNQQPRATDFYTAGTPSRSSLSTCSSFLGRFGQPDRGRLRLKILSPQDFGSGQNQLEEPILTKGWPPNLTFTDSDSELEEVQVSEADEDRAESPSGSTEMYTADQRRRRMEALGMDSAQLFDSDDEDFSAQSSTADGETEAYAQEEKETSEDFELSCDDLHNLFKDLNLENLTTLEEASNHEEKSITKAIGKNKEILKYRRRKKLAGQLANSEAQHLNSKFLSKMKISLFPLKRSLLQEAKKGKVRRGKKEDGFKGDSKLHRGNTSFNEDN